MANQPDPYAPRPPVAGKPIVKSYPSPDLNDRIIVIRKDSRVAGYELPAHGDHYTGPEAQKMEDWIFATAVPSDQTGWVDWYYLNARMNEDEFNALVEYPYADKDYPRVTRTYTELRSVVFPAAVEETPPIEPSLPVEVEADVADPVYSELLLVDHAIKRFDDPILDSLFVNVQRVYERLPSPIIRTYNQTEVKQVVTIDTQEVVTEDVPVSSATTEVLKVERTTTAKARVTTGTVPDVFPADSHEIERPDLMPPEFRGLIPTVTEAENLEGDAVLPTLGTGELQKSETQVNEFVKRDSVTKRAAVPLPKTLVDKDIEHLSQGRFGEGFSSEGIITKTVDVGDQNLTVGIFVTDSTVKQLGDGNSIKETHSVTDWPILRERNVDERDGIAVNIEKKVILPLNAAFAPHAAAGQYVDVMPYDRWRSIQITSKVDLSTLPNDPPYATFIDVNFPPTLLEVIGNYTDSGGSSQSSTESDTDNVAVVSVSAGAMGTIGVLAKHNYRGKAFGTVTRKWFSAPPSKAQLVAMGAFITPILPSDGFATLVSKHVSFGQTRGDTTTADSNEGSLKSETVDISGYLTHHIEGGVPVPYKVTNANYPSAGSSASATAGDNTALLILPGPVMTMYVNMPFSTPNALQSGTDIVVDVQVSKQRFGLWLVEMFTATIP